MRIGFALVPPITAIRTTFTPSIPDASHGTIAATIQVIPGRYLAGVLNLSIGIVGLPPVVVKL